MKASRILRSVFVSGAAAALLMSRTRVLVIQGQGQPADASAAIQSLGEPGETLAVKSTSDKTGLVTFATSPGRGILVPQEAGAPAEQRALGFVDLYGARFGLANRSQLQMSRVPSRDELGIEHVRFQQVHNGVPITGGEFVVHLNGARVTAANGLVLADLPATVIPSITAGAAEEAAQQLIAKHKPADAPGAQYSEPRLEIFNQGFLKTGTYPSRLAWFVEATGPALREFIWVDAQSGVILMNFSQLTKALSRSVYTSNYTSTLPGTLRRTEGSPAFGDADTDNAYLYAGVTYNYFFTNHSRDSFDGAGAAIISSVHYCAAGQPCPNYPNAFWNGTQMVYGDNYASADDVVGHELTHAVTERTAGLFYYAQSGAMNESFSDIFGETVDFSSAAGGGNDTVGVRWDMGEDLPIGAIRNMMNPNLHQNPNRMGDSFYFSCSESGYTDPDADHGGVHGNSGVPNHAYALMVDGGFFNGQTITGIGLTKAAKIQYRALTTYLVSGSGFLDDYNALNQSCTDLVGTAGITVTDCTQVNKALLAVEMNATWGCPGAVAAPPVCPTGSPSFVFQDTFEAVTSNWTASTTGVANTTWGRDSGLAKGGVWLAYGPDADSPADSKYAMTSSVVVPAAGRIYFDIAYEFENDIFGTAYDGGVLEYSTNAGASWLDASSLIDAGRGYSGSIDFGTGNPLQGRPAFVGTSYGYTGTRLNLASLAGQSVRFRFRIGSDDLSGSLGWAVDNFGIYSCGVSTKTLTVSKTGTGTGTVTSSPGGISCGATCSASFDTGTGVSLFASQATGSSFTAWSGGGCSGNSSCVVTMSAAQSVAAQFTRLIGSLSITLGGLPPGTVVTLGISGPDGFNTTHDTLTGTGFNYSDVGTGTYTVTAPTTVIGGSTYVAKTQSKAVNSGTTATIDVLYKAFTDTLVAGSSPIKAVHITELRTRINAVRVARGLGAFSWTDPTLTPGSSIIRAVHVAELRSALGLAYVQAGLQPPTYTDPALGSTIPVKTVHINELRAAVIAIE